MAEVVQEKVHGLKFAERQLLRHGWEHGKGLGRAEDGISEAIKVKVKCDKGGVGHKEGDQFTFHWWDHVFNKASSSLQVETDQNGVQLKKAAEDDEDEMISNKKPQKAARAKEKLYGCFVKSATLLSGQEQPEPKSSDSAHSSSSEDDDHRLDHSGTFRLTDEDLMKVCGGRTAHKGARHGLTMSAKLARLEQQEAEFMAKYGQKNQSASLVCATPTCQSADRRAERQKDEAFRRRKKKKNKKKKSSVNGQSEAPESPEADVEPKQKKKETSEDGTDGKTRRKQKKTRRDSERDEEGRTSSLAAETPETKMKKKSCKHHRELEEIKDSVQSEPPPPNSAARTKKKKSSLLDVTENEHEKCQEDKRETLPPKKKKKKKSKE